MFARHKGHNPDISSPLPQSQVRGASFIGNICVRIYRDPIQIVAFGVYSSLDDGHIFLYTHVAWRALETNLTLRK